MNRYDEPIEFLGQRIQERIDAARAAHEAASRELRLATWLRWTSHQRHLDALQLGLHWWHRSTLTDAWCTCGLLHRLPAPAVVKVAGHRRHPGARPTEVLTVYRGLGYLTSCQRCGWYHLSRLLEDASNAASDHRHDGGGLD